MTTVDLLFYLHADEKREEDVHWRDRYTFAVLPVVRTVIDCLYTVTRILQNPSIEAVAFRTYGYQQADKALKRDVERYRDKPDWKNHLAKQRQNLDAQIEELNIEYDHACTMAHPW